MPKRWSGTTPEERGKQAEEQFFKAWENQTYFPVWMVSIERPTRHEDISQKTDAVIVAISGPNLRIQIKSYWLHDSERRTLMEYGVIPLSITAGDSLQRIRKNTYIALTKFSTFNKKVVEKHTTVPTKNTWQYYKKGKRYKSKYV